MCFDVLDVFAWPFSPNYTKIFPQTTHTYTKEGIPMGLLGRSPFLAHFPITQTTGRKVSEGGGGDAFLDDPLGSLKTVPENRGALMIWVSMTSFCLEIKAYPNTSTKVLRVSPESGLESRLLSWIYSDPPQNSL